MNDLSGYFKTGKRLQIALDSADQIDGLEDMLDNWFFDRYEIEPDTVCEAPYWINEGDPSYHWNGKKLYLSEDRWEPCISARWIEAEDLRGVQLWVQYVPGYYEPNRYGQVLEIDGETYVYVCSQNLDEEQEHQAEDGKCAYEYRGYSFLRVLVKLEDITPRVSTEQTT